MVLLSALLFISAHVAHTLILHELADCAMPFDGCFNYAIIKEQVKQVPCRLS
jgi:hypothetical protein